MAHDIAPLADAIAEAESAADPILVFGASAITDRRDVIPAAIEQAGGRIAAFGMPVDPGNLLLSATLGGATVVGLPGCARSPKLNGFDFVLWRMRPGLPVGRTEIAAMGVGGLLTEIPTRPQPRDEPAAEAPRAAPDRRRRAGRGPVLADGVATSCWPTSAASRWCGTSSRRRLPARPRRHCCHRQRRSGVRAAACGPAGELRR